MSGYLSMEEVLDLVTNDDFGHSGSDDSVDEGDGIYAYLGKPETNTGAIIF